MTALAADKVTPKRIGLKSGPWTILDADLIYVGALVMLNTTTGEVRAGMTGTGYVGLGVLAEGPAIDNALDGETVQLEHEIYGFVNSASADEISDNDVGKVCYIVDDQTVALTDGSSTRSPAGRIMEVGTDDLVYVELKPLVGELGDMLSANDLSDVASAATSRINLGIKHYVTINIPALDGTDVYRVPAPVAGNITGIRTNLQAAVLVTGDATITGKIGAVAITNGVVTITQSGSAVGDTDVAAPTAARAVVVGDDINFTVGGSNSDAVANCNLTVEITEA